MSEMILEYCDSRGTQIGVDREAGVIRGVKILGLRSRNGREYSAEALREAAPLVREREGEREPSEEFAGDGARLSRSDRDDAGRATRRGRGVCLRTSISTRSTRSPNNLIWDAEHAAEKRRLFA